MALFDACKLGDLDQVRELIAGGVDPRRTDKDGWTALHYACRYAVPGIATHNFIHNSAQKTEHTVSSCVVSDSLFVCRNGCLKVVKHLIEAQQCDVNCINNLWETPLHLACRYVL